MNNQRGNYAKILKGKKKKEKKSRTNVNTEKHLLGNCYRKAGEKKFKQIFHLQFKKTNEQLLHETTAQG